MYCFSCGIKIFLIDNQINNKNLKNKVKKVLPVMKKAVLLHPQNTEGWSEKSEEVLQRSLKA